MKWMHPPLVGSVFPQVLVEDGGGEDGVRILILQLQVPKVCVGLPVRTYYYLSKKTTIWQHEALRRVKTHQTMLCGLLHACCVISFTFYIHY